MSSADESTHQPEGAVALEFHLPHPPRKVWRALTDPALLTEWLLPTIGHRLERSADFTFQAPPQPEWDGTVHCRYLEIDEPRKLGWSWVVGDIDTVVTITLTPSATGTQLNLLQTGFTVGQKRNLSGARYGWKIMGDKLANLLTRIS